MAVILVANFSQYSNGGAIDFLTQVVYTSFYGWADIFDIISIVVLDTLAVATFLIGLIVQSIKKSKKRTI